MGKIVSLLPYSPPNRTKMVLEGYPHGFPMDRLEEHPLIESATRMKFRLTKDTRQVLVTVLGDPTKEISLGIFSIFTLTPYYPEPLRCTKCRRFDHHMLKCKAQLRCGICSEPHATDICLTKFKGGEKTVARCPNCGKPHHAWNPTCPEHVKRLRLPPETT